jgi:hypothetical protein
MLAFAYYPGCENMLVNHKDGNKTNCAIWNLEWCTNSENMIHAVQTGLTGKSSYSDEDIRKVCELLEDQSNTLTYISEVTGVGYTTVQSIQRKGTWTHISDQYNIHPRKINNNLSMDEVKAICKWFELHPIKDGENYDMHCIAALTDIGYPNPGTNLIRTTKKIFTKETYWYISKDYNF